MDIKKLYNEKNIDGILLTDLINVRYSSGFTGSTGVVLLTSKKKYFFTDFRYLNQCEKEVMPNGFKVIEINSDPFPAINNILKSNQINKLGIEGNDISIDKYKHMIDALDSEMYSIEDFYKKKRMIKKEFEITSIKKAAKIADEAFEKILPLIRPGISEKSLANELEYEMKKLGGEKKAFDTIVASNERSAFPHGVASEKIIQSEGFIKFDFGTCYNGYFSDMTRTVYLGNNISEKHFEIYNTVLEAQLLSIKSIKEGISNYELDKIARNYINNKGYGENFGHGLGHGLGLEVHEYPMVSQKGPKVELKENMIITIEPGIYIEGFGGVRIEDDVIVKRNGYEIINNTSKDLMIINV